MVHGVLDALQCKGANRSRLPSQGNGNKAEATCGQQRVVKQPCLSLECHMQVVKICSVCWVRDKLQPLICTSNKGPSFRLACR